jgi:O-antigen ligase
MVDREASTASQPGAEGGPLRLEELAVVVMFAALTFDNLNLLGAAGNPAVIDVSLDKVATLVALAAWAGRALLSRDQDLLSIIGKNPTSYFALAFIAVSVLSNVNVTETVPLRGAPGPWVVVLRRITLVVLYFVVLVAVRRRKVMDYVIIAWVVGGLFSGAAGIYEIVTGEQFLEELASGRTELVRHGNLGLRIQGFEADADVFATFTLFALALLTYLWHRAAGHLKLGVLLCAAVYVVDVVGAGSKGGWLGMVLILVLYMALAEDRQKWWIAGASVVAGTAVFVVLSYTSDTVGIERITRFDSSNHVRWGQIRMCWAMVEDHPVIGSGSGAFVNEQQRYFPTASSEVPHKPLPALNAYMQTWAENGSLGLSVLLLLFGSAFLSLWGAVGNAADHLTKMLGVSLLILYACMLWILIVFPAMDSKYLWLPVGLAVAYSNLPETRERGVSR